jgi:hypothetical protein
MGPLVNERRFRYWVDSMLYLLDENPECSTPQQDMDFASEYEDELGYIIDDIIESRERISPVELNLVYNFIDSSNIFPSIEALLLKAPDLLEKV